MNIPNSKLRYNIIKTQIKQYKQKKYNRKATNIIIKINPKTPLSFLKKPELDILITLKK